jgi:hypothetical protein
MSRAVLERVAKGFEDVLWQSDAGAGVRGWLSRWGIHEQTLRKFQVGYAPARTGWLFEHVAPLGADEEDLVRAGVATRSARGNAHAWFHARVIFPIREPDGQLVGFAGLATHLGPSWPLWVTSPVTDVFDSGQAMFGIDKAAPALRAGRALIVRDCVQAIALSQAGRDECVAVVQSPITRSHLAMLSGLIGTRDLQVTRRDGLLGAVAKPAGREIADSEFASRSTPNGFALIHSHRKAKPPTPAEPSGPEVAESELRRTAPTRPAVYLSGLLLGAGLPLGLLFLAAGGNGDPTPALNVVIVAVALLYVGFSFVVARVSARRKQKVKARRMREPWARGSGEWQPPGWTYHHLEEVLVGAALVSAMVCITLLMTVGGFLGSKT